MKFKGLNPPVTEPVEKEKFKRTKHRLFMKKDKKKNMLGNFGRKMFGSTKSKDGEYPI